MKPQCVYLYVKKKIETIIKILQPKKIDGDRSSRSRSVTPPLNIAAKTKMFSQH
ncbi:hypothetical protein TTHERM_000630339 (macronuclear) [Tetrahymena thermophila SB210]|uniref:Uncharacterized protein n=1 Tax=Tetrahymena thermophila (strain SB210) TaxID=312017 RepID=W7X583_TETTS|nr:hypothetical protein TTHERM_000630339 [Tetrahymena thermophila SB210]EWS72567.1 hypothetical protein TTHERM_000630339 [Tetrahymena thermophila SB210]|eukprot:XP_012654850.1 hypothetical protein TTHERM_000630339 [Tetrahymena thermophila SB210]